MIRFRALPYLATLLPVAICFSFSSCSGPLTPCTVNCGGGGGGTGNVNVTVTATPSTAFSFPFLAWQILSVQLINSSTATTVVQGALPPVDFARLQTDSQFLGTGKSISAGAYTGAKIQLAPSTASSYFFNSSSATLLGCVAGAVCKIPNTVAGFGTATVAVPISFTVTAN